MLRKFKTLHKNFTSCKVKFQQIDLLHVNAIKGTEPNFIAHRNITFTFFIFMCACPVVTSLRMLAYLQNFRIGVRKLLVWKVWIDKTLINFIIFGLELQSYI